MDTKSEVIRHSPLRVLQFVNTLEFGGATDYALTLCENLDPARFRTWLATGPGSGWGDRAERCNESVLYLDSMKPTHTSESTNTVFGDVRALVELVRFLRREKIELIHTHGSKSRLIGGLAGLIAGVPRRVQSAHGFAFNTRMTKWKYRVFVALEKLMGLLHHELVLESRHDLGVARQYKLSRRTSCIYTGIEFDPEISSAAKAAKREELGVASSAVIVTMIGRLTHQKDPHTFVRAARIVRRSRPEVVFLVVGDGDLLASTNELVDGDDGILMLGRRTDTPDLIAASDIYMLCSRWEGIPLTVLASMHAKKPLVVTDKLGLPEVAVDGETGILVDEGDPDAYARAVMKLVDDPVLRLRLGHGGHELVVQRHSLSSMMENFESLFEGIPSSKAHSESA